MTRGQSGVYEGDARRSVCADLLAQGQMHRQMQEGVAHAGLWSELGSECALALFQPSVVLGMALQDIDELRLERRERQTVATTTPRVEPAASQSIPGMVEEGAHRGAAPSSVARVLRLNAQRSAIGHAGQSGLRALQR